MFKIHGTRRAVYGVNYLESLDAMHEAVMTNHRIKNTVLAQTHYNNLFNIVERDRRKRKAFVTSHIDVANAAAKQRAEAFLKTLKLWKP